MWDLVAVYKPTAKKMELRYEGPYVVTEDIHERGVTFRVAAHRHGGAKTSTVHGSMLKPWHKRRASPHSSIGQASQDVDDLGEALEQAEDNVSNPQPAAKPTVEADRETMTVLEDLIKRKTASVQEVVQVLDHTYNGAHWYKLQIKSLARPTGWIPQRLVNKFWSPDMLSNWRRDRAMEADEDRAQELLGDVTRQPALDNSKPERPRGYELYPLGTKVCKVFRNKRNEDQEYRGKVTGYNSRRGWFKITYADGDWEEMTATEVKHHLNPSELHDTDDEMENQGEYGLNIWDDTPEEDLAQVDLQDTTQD